jgi:CRISPR/Cas system-associated endonuclease Cas1
MTHIILTPGQVRLYHEAKEPVQICDTQGKVLGRLPAAAQLERVELCDENEKGLGTWSPVYSAEFMAELKRRAREPGRKRYSSEQVTRHMQALAEVWKREGSLSEKRAHEILEKIRVEDSQ